MQKTDVKYITPFLILGAFFFLKAIEPELRQAQSPSPQTSFLTPFAQK